MMYSLFSFSIYLQSETISSPNVKHSTSTNVYLDCYEYLKKSILASGCVHYLVTDQQTREYIRKVRPHLLEFVYVADFTYIPPKHAAFKHAHFKIDALKFAQEFILVNDIEYFLYLDLDVVCHPRFISKLMASAGDKGLYCYNIYDQVEPRWSENRVKDTLSKLTNRPNTKRFWAGGEILFGRHNSLLYLNETIKNIWPSYVKNIDLLHHQGDESVVTAALSQNISHVSYLENNLINRIWCSPTVHNQNLIRKLSKSDSLHLPDGKDIIGWCYRRGAHNLYQLKFLIILRTLLRRTAHYVKSLVRCAFSS